MTIESEKTEWNELVNRCTELIKGIHDNEMDKIRMNLALGELVADVIEGAKYGDRAVLKLANEISMKRGKTVYPQRLYEAYSVWKTVKSIEKVEEIQEKLGHEITWNWLVNNSSTKPEHEKGKELREYKIEKKFRKVEKAIEELDDIDPKELDPIEREEVRGLTIATIQNAQFLLSKINDYEEKEKTVQNVKSEENDLNKALLEVIKHDEITGEESESLHIHSFGPADIAHSIVVSSNTHKKIHDNKIPYIDVIETINKRNAEYAKKYIELVILEKQVLDYSSDIEK